MTRHFAPEVYRLAFRCVLIRMDIPRKGAARNRTIKRIVIGAVVALAAGGATYSISKMQPAAPSVERSVVWIETVKRGPMLRQERGLGTLVPEEILWIPAETDGRIERIVLRPGATVRPDSIIMVLTNPDLELAAFDLEWQVKAAEANLRDLKVQLESKKLTQQSDTAGVESQYSQAKLTADRDEALTKFGLKADLEGKLSRAKAEELANRLAIEKKRLAINQESIDAQLAAQMVQVEKLKAALELKRKQVGMLKIRAGNEGVLQEMTFEAGQRVTAGTVLAKVAQPWKLKAAIKIAETRAKEIVIGQVASIDTRNGVIEGRVSRIDPAAQNGTVTVDVKLTGALPQGARPELSVDGTIDLERIADVLYMARPVFAQANSSASLFKYDPQTKEATRVKVKLGRISVNAIEVLEGLQVNDQVVLSDMSQWDSRDRIRILN